MSAQVKSQVLEQIPSHGAWRTLRSLIESDFRRVLTLVFIWDVVLSLGVDQQRGQQEGLVQLILQVDVVVP